MRTFFLLFGTCLSQEAEIELGTAETVETMAYGTCMFFGLWGLGLEVFFLTLSFYTQTKVFIVVERKTSKKAILAAILMYYYDFEILKLCKRQVGSLKNKSSRVRHVLLHPKTDDPLEEALL